jgi:hypothetical protein
MEGNTLGLYQDTILLLNTTATVAGTVNTPSFSAANFGGGAVSYTSYGTITGTTPTVALALQVSADGGVTWQAVPATSNSLTDALTVGSATPTSAGVVVKPTTGTVYCGNLLRVAVTFGGTGSLSIPIKLSLDAAKRFPDNA